MGDLLCTGNVSNVLDQINLEQALVDAELANRRVIELTARLYEVEAELANVKHQLQQRRSLARRILSRAKRLIFGATDLIDKPH